MSYRFRSDGPTDVDAFTSAAFRQPQGALFRRAYWSFHFWSLLLMAFIVLGSAGIGALRVDWYAPRTMIEQISLAPLPFLIAALAWVRFNTSLIKTMYRRMLDSPLYNGLITYEVTEKGFAMHSETALWSVDWPVTNKVAKDPKGIFMHAGSFIYLIPKSVPPSDMYDPMWADIQSWFGAAR